MDDQEIIARYRNRAYPPREQIKVLHELNPYKSQDEILSILHSAGEALEIARDPPVPSGHRGREGKYTVDEWREVIELKLAGFTTSQIIKMTGMPKTTLANWKKIARRHGIEIPEGGIMHGQR